MLVRKAVLHSFLVAFVSLLSLIFDDFTNFFDRDSGDIFLTFIVRNALNLLDMKLIVFELSRNNSSQLDSEIEN